MVLIFCVRQLGEAGAGGVHRRPAPGWYDMAAVAAGKTHFAVRLGASLLMAVGHLSRSFVHIRLCHAGAAALSVGTSLGTGRGTEQGDE